MQGVASQQETTTSTTFIDKIAGNGVRDLISLWRPPVATFVGSPAPGTRPAVGRLTDNL